MGTRERMSGIPEHLHYLEFIAVAEDPAEVVAAIRRYLAAWPKERINNVQMIDGGWAPFDMSQKPSPVNGTQDLRCIRDAVHGQCIGLRKAGLALTPELMELDEIFFIATQMAESLQAPGYKTRSSAVAARTGLFALV